MKPNRRLQGTVMRNCRRGAPGILRIRRLLRRCLSVKIPVNTAEIRTNVTL